jgi:multidrug resistance efflux pump
MNSAAPSPVPIPIQQRWRDARLRLLPVVVFVTVLGAIAFLWKDHIAPPTFIGQAEPVVANVSSPKPGVLAQCSVTRFQRVKAGDPVGQLMVADPRVLDSSLAVIRAEIDMLCADVKPIAAQQRTAMDYDQLRLDWMKQRAQLAGAQVNLQLAETESRRMEELFKEKIVSQRVFEQAKAARERLSREVAELTSLVTEAEQSFKMLQLTNGTDLSKVSEDPLRAAIAVQESKLRLTEAELSPVTLRAPIDGIVSLVYHQPGEAVTAGQPIIAIATLNPVRIVGYLRPPLGEDPRVGAQVEVRTRGQRREIGSANIVQVGTQLENVPPTLAIAVKPAGVELGLPVDISLPPNLKIRPGELVDVTLVPQAD